MPAVTIAIAKKKGSNAVSVARTVLEEAEKLRAEVLPGNVEMVVTRNYGLTANEKVNDLVEALAVAILIVIALLTLSLGWRAAFVVAVAIVLVWAATGPMFGFSDTWQLVINTGMTIVTFLMVFLIQNTQNRDSEAVHLKLDELIRAVPGAHDSLLDIEELDDETLERMCRHYALLARRARGELAVRRAFTFEEEEGLEGASPSGSRAVALSQTRG